MSTLAGLKERLGSAAPSLSRPLAEVEESLSRFDFEAASQRLGEVTRELERAAGGAES
jgi:hypothetical protein